MKLFFSIFFITDIKRGVSGPELGTWFPDWGTLFPEWGTWFPGRGKMFLSCEIKLNKDTFGAT